MMKSSFKHIVASAWASAEGPAFPFGRWFARFGRTSALAACLMTATPSHSAWAVDPQPNGVGHSAPTQVEQLIKSLQSPDSQTRKNAAQDLTWLGEAAKPTVPQLLRTLNDQDPIVRATAARAVWEIDRRADHAVPVLVGLLQSEDSGHRELAAYFLGPMGEAATRAIPSLRRAIADQNPNVRVHAAEALTQIDPVGTEAVDVLLEAIQHPSADVRSLAAMAFSNVAPIHTERVVPVLSHALNDADPGVQTSAELSLTNFNLDVQRSDQEFPSRERTSSPVIVKTIPVAPQAENITPFASPNSASEQLSGLSKELEVAVRDLSDSNATVRKNALERIGWMGSAAEPALADVTVCLQDPELEIRAYAAKTLWDVDPLSALAAVATLRDMLDSTQPGIRPLAAFYLGYMGPHAASALPTLKRALTSADRPEQLQIAEAIARINPEDADAVSVLIDGLRDPNSQVRFQAAYALSVVSPIHAERVVPELATAMRDQSPHVRQAAELALASFPPEPLPAAEIAIQPRSAAPDAAIPPRSAAPEVTIQPRFSAPKIAQEESISGSLEIIQEVEPIPAAPAIVANAEPFPAAPAIVPGVDRIPAAPAPVAKFEPIPAAPAIVEEQPFPAGPEIMQQIEPVPDAPVIENAAEPVDVPQLAQLDAEPLDPAPMARFEEAAGPEGTSPPPGSTLMTRAKVNHLGLGDDYKPISSVGASISPKRRDEDGRLLPLPTNYGAAWLQEVGTHYQPIGESRPWSVQSVQYAASGFCHRPLYFEEINLERYGHNFGHYVQPFVSGASFFGRIPLLPYMTAAEPPCECQYTLGHYRAGSCAPFRPSHLPWSTTGALLQGGIVTGLVFAIY